MKKYVALLSLAILASCSSRPELVQMTNQGPAQGSTFSISYLVPEGVDYRSEIDSVLDAMDAQMSLWVGNSEISVLNNGDSIFLSTDFYDVILKSLMLSELTDGAFDISIAPLIQAWGFSGGSRKDAINIDSLMNFVGYKGMVAHRPGKRLEKYALPQGYAIDVNAIAQGYTVDVVASLLESEDVSNYMIEIGGEVRCNGVNARGRKWRIGIEEPSEERVTGQFQTIVELDSMSLATSGNYRKYWEDETGQKVVHSIDPETGRPVISNLLSASIIAPTATTADALATACMIKGIVGATNMLDRFPGVEGYFIVGAKFGEIEVIETPGWKRYTVN
jgi:thiamine biosynthesis lipoprotein